ncbi:MAG TPA: hypothetical protein VEA61_15935 [Allosphingosinicella sp.]|nr:hypothetical protein [Allosphingosinicella sp.]
MVTPPDLDAISNQILAIAALGTAAFGLVDATKVFRGGISNVGFGHVVRALTPFAPALERAVGAEDGGWKGLLRAHWINGRAKAEQKAIAVSLIQLGLTEETARTVAEAGQVDPDGLVRTVKALIAGDDLSSTQINLFSRFKTAVEARMDAAYERAEQSYRNAARFVAGLFAVALAVVAARLFYPETRVISAALVGLIAVPLAPIAKDLVSTLSAAAKAIGSRVAP